MTHMRPSVTLRRAHRKGPQARRTAAKSRAEDAYRQTVKRAIWAQRDACQLCFNARWRECLTEDHMHEDPSRAKTRGLPMEQRFNERVCGRLCEACHRDVTEHRIRVVFEDEVERFAGRVWCEAKVIADRA